MLDYFADFVFTSLHAGTARAARRGPREGGVGGRVAVGVSLWVALALSALGRRPRERDVPTVAVSALGGTERAVSNLLRAPFMRLVHASSRGLCCKQ